MKDYKIHVLVSGDRESAKPFYPFFRHRGLDLNTQYAFSDFFVLADRDVPGRKGSMIRNLSFPLTVPGGEGNVVGFEERGRPGRDGKTYKGKAAGSNGSLGLWIASPSGTSLKDADRVLLFESAYDAMAYWQLHRSSDRELRKAVFVSTGGNGRQFTANFMTVAKEMKPYSDVARAYKDTPGFIETDHEKESAFFKLPKEVKEQYFKVEELREDLREGYLCQEDKDELKAQIAQGWRVFNEMVDACIVHVERELPGERYKDFNDELLGREMTERKAVGCDLDGDGAVETEESHEERHRYHR